MRYLLLIQLFLASIFFSQTKVKLGIDNLKEDYSFLIGKNVGLITNATGVDSKLNSTIDILYNLPGVKLVALFGPEHGVRGNIPAGEKIESYIDQKTGLPVYSLYGKTRKLTKEMLNGIDVLIYDIQDIGVRSYTYISTMGLAMEAAAENNIEFVVLDRPNPLTGEKFEGSLVRKEFISFIGQYPIPYVYGLTCGELAIMINEEGWLNNKLKCKLKVVQMTGWKRNMKWEDTGLHWVPTSPHIPHYYSSQYYAATGILGELGVISEGVGYTLPFQLLGAEWINENLIANELNNLKLDGVIFRPVVWRPFYGNFQNKVLHGVQVHITDFRKCNLTAIQFIFLEQLKKLYPDKDVFALASPNRISSFDKATGWDQIRFLFSKNFKYEEIKKYWEAEANEFKSKAAKYFLY